MRRHDFLKDKALYLDVDGTLTPIVDNPKDVYLTTETKDLLHRLHHSTHGAVALVSGRDLFSLRLLSKGLDVALISEHGAKVEDQTGAVIWQSPIDLKTQHQLQQSIFHWAKEKKQLYIESKCYGTAIHYRQLPNLRPLVLQFVLELLSQFPNYTYKKGKMVIEIHLKGYDKGTGIAQLMCTRNFLNKTPIMIGDDMTDEPGFDLVNRHGGISIKIGSFQPDSLAQYFIQDPQSLALLFKKWL